MCARLLGLFATPWTVAHQAPLSMGFSRQEYWSGWPFSSSGDLPDPGIEPGSPTFQGDSVIFTTAALKSLSVKPNIWAFFQVISDA